MLILNRRTYFSTMLALRLFPVMPRAQTSDLTGKTTFASQTKMSTFAFDWRKGMIFVPVRLNGSRPLSFVLDTGSTRNIVDRTLAKSLGLKASGTGSMQGADAGRIPVAFIHDVSIGLPGLESTRYELST